MNEPLKESHNKYAPYWAVAMVVLTIVSLSTSWFDWGPFGKGYVLDICGPAWNYILFRILFTNYNESKWRRFFSPDRTLAVFSFVLIAIEGMQYLEWYESTYDPWDILAYFSLLVPIYLVDKTIIRNAV